MQGEAGTLYKINRNNQIIFGSDEMKTADLTQNEKKRLFHLAHTSGDENLSKLAREYGRHDLKTESLKGGCGFFSGLFGCDAAEQAKLATEAQEQGDKMLSELNKQTKEFYLANPDYVNDLKDFSTYQFAGINDSFSRADEDVEKSLPPYCSNFPSVGTESYKEYMGEVDSSEKIYETTCDDPNQTPFVITVGNLVDNYLDVERFNYQKGQDLLEKELANESMKQIIETRSAYASVHPGLEDDEDDKLLGDLQSCVNDNAGGDKALPSSKEVQVLLGEKVAEEDAQASAGNDYQTPFYYSNVKNAIFSAALLQLRDVGKAETESEILKLSNEHQAKCLGRYVDGTALDRDDPICQNFSERKSEIEKAGSIREGQLMSPIAQLYKKDPMLFTTVNDNSIFDWFNYQPAQSDFAQKLSSVDKAGELVNGVKEAIAKNPENPHEAAASFLQEQDAMVKQVAAAAQNDSSIKTLGEEKTKEHIRGLTESAVNLCKGEIDHLHHFPDLFAKVTDRIAKTEGPQAREKIMQMQGAYCYMLRKDPPNQETGFTLLQGLGIGLAVLGTAAQFVPVLGTAVGTGMILAGGAMTMTDAAIKLNRRMGELSTQNAMLAAGWSDYKQYLDAKSKVMDAGADMAIEATFFAADLAATKSLVTAVKAREIPSTVADVPIVGRGNVVTPEIDVAATKAIDAVSGAQDAAVARVIPEKPIASAIDEVPISSVDEIRPVTPGTEVTLYEPQVLKASEVNTAQSVTPNLPAVVDEISPVRAAENLPAIRPTSTDIVPVSAVDEVKPVKATRTSTDVTIYEPPVLRPEVVDSVTPNLPAVLDQGVGARSTRNLPAVVPDEVVKPVDNALALRAESVKPEVIAPIERSKSLTVVRDNPPAVIKPVETVEVIKPVDSAIDELAGLRSEISRRPAASGRIDLAATLSKNSGISDDFMKALAEVPSATRQRLLDHIDKGHFAPEELSKIMDDAVASLRRACQ